MPTLKLLNNFLFVYAEIKIVYVKFYIIYHLFTFNIIGELNFSNG